MTTIRNGYHYVGRIITPTRKRKSIKKRWLIIGLIAGFALMMWWNFCDAKHDVAHACAWAEREERK